MLGIFLKHQWQSFWRSKSKGGNIAVQIIMGILVLYLVACAVFTGVYMSMLIPHFFPQKDMIDIFNGLILYYFATDFLIRLQMQELPTLAIVPYLHLNIPKHKLVSFLNIRALFSVFNYLPLLIFTPFCFLQLKEIYGAGVTAAYLIAIISLAIFNNYFALYVKRLSTTNLKIVLAGLILIIALGLLEYLKVFSIAAVSGLVFKQVTAYPLISLLFPFIAILSYRLNTLYLKKNLYIEELSAGIEKKSNTDYPFLERFGAVGVLAALEIKLILRNKRSKSTVAKGLLFLFYGLLLYKQNYLERNEFGMMLFAAVFMTGNMVLLYGQFMFGWQAAEFDGMLANKMSVKNFIKAKFLLFNLSSTFLVIMVSLYGFMSWKLLLIQFAAYLYSIGIGAVIVLYLATLNYKYIDLSKSSGFNWQGVGASTMIMGLPVFILPFIIYLPVSHYANPYWGLFALALLGLAGIITRSFWVNFLVRQFNKRKYKIAAGFREH
ncbi:DUF5687 family protein [Pedobacter sp. MC2016-14]|uniref:DUF5687 family protein n=1 Tax=Pedobacter sp. MC2016-14 TaxID=2897327 RepID=UPI001E4133C3|nr:DUF5687 family protein [Pedobacter sp. MC2016-14]MCD0487059.1 DUF5687 family protein [Pedobacter sp. MC2016-14]